MYRYSKQLCSNLRNNESFVEYYEVIILVETWSNPKKKILMVLMIDLITLRPKLLPYNIHRMIPYYFILCNFQQ